MAVAVEFKALPPEEAIAFFRQKGYRTSFSYLDMMHRAHSEAFTVAGVARLDVLEDIRAAVAEGLEKGTTLADFRKEMKRRLSAKGWWEPKEVSDDATGEVKTVDLTTSKRLRTIFNTNMRTAYAAGQWTRIQRTKEALPYLVYRATDKGERNRPLHRKWGGLDGGLPVCLPVDHPWWKTHFPPSDWNCGCHVLQMTEGMLKRRGWKVWDEPPDDGPPRIFVNRRTGERSQVPAGVDPSFAYNPGDGAYFPDPARYKGAAFGEEAARLAVQSQNFDDLVGARIKGAAPVGWVDDAIAEALDVTVRRVDLSSDTMAKQAARHPEITLEEYRQLPELFRAGLVVKDEEPGVIQLFGLLRDARGTPRVYRATVKRTGSGEALFMTTFHRVRGRQLEVARELPVVRAGVVE